jgi:hypothetical protein
MGNKQGSLHSLFGVQVMLTQPGLPRMTLARIACIDWADQATEGADKRRLILGDYTE